jgi:lactoylglutathione lyase
MQEITGIGHVAIRVKDIGRTLDFYVKGLGFPEMFRLEREGKLWIVYLRITDEQYLEVFPEAEGDHAPPPEAKGLNHVCLTVSDMDAALKRIRASGIPIAREKQLGLDGNLQAWLEDPDGNRIELMQMAPNGMQVQAVQRMRDKR